MQFLRVSKKLYSHQFLATIQNKLPAINYNWPHLDYDYICDPKNINEIEENIRRRKNVGDIRKLHDLLSRLEDGLGGIDEQVLEEFLRVAKQIPNRTHPDTCLLTEPRVVKVVGEKTEFAEKPLDFETIAKSMRLFRREHIGNLVGNRNYYFLGDLANLEHSLIKYTVNYLIARKFSFISVPDLLPVSSVENCGVNVTDKEHEQVYTVNAKSKTKEPYCLSGTAEMAIAAHCSNKVFEESELPKLFAALSRCYRAEASSVLEERGIYRVHQFNKVEMFAVTTPETSDEALEQILKHQIELYENLNLHFKVLEMPPHELGAAAYRKFDIEAWMPGRNQFGEITSCSNCTDYQARRLNIRYRNRSNNSKQFVHTVNGTACAIPRLLIALLETNQTVNKTVKVPEKLRKFFGSLSEIRKSSSVPVLKLIKN